MDQQTAEILLKRYRMGLCTAEEAAQVESWYETMVTDGQWEWTDAERASFAQTTWAVIQAASNIPAVPVRRLKFSRIAAAAVIIGVLLAGAFYWQQHTSRTKSFVKQDAVPQEPDVQPGGSKAVLTLAGNRQIILDSAVNGELARQGGTQIRKTDSGKLEYLSSKDDHSAAVLNTLTTPRGGQYQLMLPDGTKVWLNAGSSITYPTAFDGPERSVTITGEAYLEIAKRAGLPFIARVRNMHIQVLGTSFNVNAYTDEATTNTTLVDGKVRIVYDKKSLTLLPGQQLQLQESGEAMYVKPDVNIDQVLAWKNGSFAFTHDDIYTVMRQLSRWYDVDVKYEGTLPDQHFSGHIGRSLPLNEVLKLLTQARVHYRIEAGNKVIIRQ